MKIETCVYALRAENTERYQEELVFHHVGFLSAAQIQKIVDYGTEHGWHSFRSSFVNLDTPTLFTNQAAFKA